MSYLHINSVPCFLLTENPCAIFALDIDDEILAQLSQDICIKLKNNQLLVKSGFENSFKCLKELLLTRIEQYVKGKKHGDKQHMTTLANTTPTQPSSNSSSIPTLTPSLITSSCSPLTIGEHRQYLTSCIRQWCIDNKTNLQFSELELKEDVDFILIFSNMNNFLEVSVQCTCGSKLNLPKNAEKFQLSNYYKHLKDSRCSHINELKRKEQEQIHGRQYIPTNPTATAFDITTVPLMSVSSDYSEASKSSNFICKKRCLNSQDSKKKMKQK